MANRLWVQRVILTPVTTRTRVARLLYERRCPKSARMRRTFYSWAEVRRGWKGALGVAGRSFRVSNLMKRRARDAWHKPAAFNLRRRARERLGWPLANPCGGRYDNGPRLVPRTQQRKLPGPNDPWATRRANTVKRVTSVPAPTKSWLVGRQIVLRMGMISSVNKAAIRQLLLNLEFRVVP